jgi:hypothetical protein
MQVYVINPINITSFLDQPHKLRLYAARKYDDEKLLRTYTDLEYRKRKLEQKRVWLSRWLDVPENRAQHREAVRAYQKTHDPFLGPKGTPWNKWLRRYAWVRDELDWKSHVPIYSTARIERNCERCNYPPSKGAMLWWVSYVNAMSTA